MWSPEQVNKLRRLARDLRRDLAGAALPMSERQRGIASYDYCRFTGSPESLLEADLAASKWLVCPSRLNPSDFKSEDGAVLAWGRARVIEKFAEVLSVFMEGGVFSCQLHSETPELALLGLWQQWPDFPELKGWCNDFVRCEIEEMSNVMCDEN